MPTQTEQSIAIHTPFTITKKRISDLLCSAFEGGSNYWYTIDTFVEPKKMEFRSDTGKIFKHLDFPLNEGGALVITTLEGDEHDNQKNWRLDLESIKKGLELMASEAPGAWADFMAESDDAGTGDTFLQLCLFGRLIYG